MKDPRVFKLFEKPWNPFAAIVDVFELFDTCLSLLREKSD